MTIERPMLPPRAESVDSFSQQPVIGQPGNGNRLSESRKPAERLSRRLVLAGVASAATLPIVAAAPATAGPHLDAELIQLGARLEPLVESYYAARAVWAPALFSANREIDREFGEDWHSEKRRAAQEQAWAKAGVDEASDKMEAIVKEIKTLAKAVHMLPARSLDGLRAHVLVAFWENAPTSAGDLEYDFEDEVVHQRLFVAAADACGLSGHVASKGFVLPFPEFDEIDEEDEDKAAVEPA
jgi:hypothetical protein